MPYSAGLGRPHCLGFRVQDLSIGFRVKDKWALGLEYRFQGLRYRALGLGLRAQGLG